MKICFVPIDNRPVCYSLALDICAVDEEIELFLPPREYLGDLKKIADIDKLMLWLENIPQCDAIILSLDTLAYGGLIPSRRGKESFDDVKYRIEALKATLEYMHAKIYAFSSIMRISNNNYNEEEKEYWKDYGKKIFEYSFNLHKNGHAENEEIPSAILEDYLETRKRNFEINKLYLEWQKEGFFDTLVFSKDDCAEYGLNVKEAKELENLGGFTKTGADEIPLTLLARAIKKDVKVFVKYTEPDCKNLISNYEDVSIEKSVQGQLDLGGFKVVNTADEADIVLIVNNFREKQGELVMGWDTMPFDGIFTHPEQPYAVADVRYANGADNEFVKELLKNLSCKNEHHRYYAPYIKEFARELRKNMTKQELVLWQYLRKEQLGVKFRRQVPIDSKYIADFACLEKKLIIEIDGGQHSGSEEDKQRTFYIEKHGFRVVRFWNNDIDNNLSGCIDYIRNIIETPFCHCVTFSPQGGQISAPLVGEVPEGGRGVLNNFYGYAGWNTSANTLGSLLAGVKVKFGAKKYNDNSFKKLQIIRFLDDWAYQANVRGQIAEPCDISELMKPYEEQLSKILDYKSQLKINYSYPWKRKFEVEIEL